MVCLDLKTGSMRKLAYKLLLTHSPGQCPYEVLIIIRQTFRICNFVCVHSFASDDEDSYVNNGKEDLLTATTGCGLSDLAILARAIRACDRISQTVRDALELPTPHPQVTT